ncbi:DNA polymerase III subunit theta [Escherichia coli]|uniref:DNA polymerase III subunit theta n=1 Tax=Escherichia coli TaxID=562 RepID=UPI00374CD517
MPDFNIAAKTKEEQGKVNVDLAASGVAYKERLKFYREKSITLPKGSDPIYLKQEDGK